MNEFLKDLSAGLAWIWMTPDEARRLLQVDGQVAYATADISSELRTHRADRIAA